MNRERWMHYTLVGIATVVLAAVAFMVWLSLDRDDREAACRDAGGVAVKSHLGPLVCIDKDAVIEVESE